MKLKERIHEKLQEKALDKAIVELVGPWGYYYLEDGTIYFNLKKEIVNLLESLEFNLPSCDEIKKLAKKKYKNFDDSMIRKIVYSFELLNCPSIYGITSEKIKDLILVAKDSDIVLSYSNFKKIDIKSEGKVQIYDCCVDSDININAKTVILEESNKISSDYININAEYVEFNRVYMVNDLNIHSKLISFNNSKVMYSNNIMLKSDMIDCENTELKAQNKIEIINPNCDVIKGVDAPLIIYNGEDITYSEGIVKPKLMKNLIEVLKEIKIQACRTIESQVETETKKCKQNLENSLNSKPITKILKK